MARNPGNYWNYIQAGSGKRRLVCHRALPVVAVVTTAGTGTEADLWTVLTNKATHEKIGFGNADTFPVLSVVDPELMLSIPPLFTAYQGFDALFHAVEGYLSRAATPVSDLLALQSVRLLAAYLPTAVEDGCDLEASDTGGVCRNTVGYDRSAFVHHVAPCDGTGPERSASLPF
jgi:alcohol dehydrogenase